MRKVTFEGRQALKRAKTKGLIKSAPILRKRPYGRAKRAGKVWVSREDLRLFMYVWLGDDTVPETSPEIEQYYAAVTRLATACGMGGVPK